MGASQIRRSLTLPLNLSDYEEIGCSRQGMLESPFRLLRNIHTGFEVQEYHLSFGSESEFHRYEESFEWRLNQPCVVNTIYFSEETHREFCSSSYGGTVFTEHIPLKLSQIKDIPWPDNLYILTAALEGFAQLYAQIGHFPVEEYMICINKQGKARVWFSENLSKITPDEDEAPQQGSERDMVRRIVQLLDINTDTSTRIQSVQSYINKHDPMPGFTDAKRLVKLMAAEHHTNIPTSFDCIMDILRVDEMETPMREQSSGSARRTNRSTKRREPVRNHRQRQPQPHTIKERIRESTFAEEMETTFHRNRSNQTDKHGSNIRVETGPQVSKGLPVLHRPPPLPSGRVVRNLHMTQPAPRTNYPMHQQVCMVRQVERPQVRYISPSQIVHPDRLVPQAQYQPMLIITEPAKENHSQERQNCRSFQPTSRRSPSRTIHVAQLSAEHRRNYTGQYRRGNAAGGNADGYVSDTTNGKIPKLAHASDHERQQFGSSKRKNTHRKDDELDIPERPNFAKKIIKRKLYPQSSEDEQEENLSKLVVRMDNEELDASHQFNGRMQMTSNAFRHSNLNAVQHVPWDSRNSVAMSHPVKNSNCLTRTPIERKNYLEQSSRERTELLQRKAGLHEAINMMRDTIKGTEAIALSPRLQNRNKQKLTNEARNYYAYKYDHSLDPQIAFDLMEKGL